MAETRLYNSYVAEAFANAGKFKVYGHTLKAFSLSHSLQLTQLGNPIWGGDGEPEPEDLAIAAQICASDLPVVDFAPIDATLDPNAQLDAWLQYIRTCAARPMLKERTSVALGNPHAAPVEILAATYLLRHTNLTEQRIWTMPYGLAWWYVETVRDQDEGDSMILTEEEAAELDRMNEADEVEKRKIHDEKAALIIGSVKEHKKRTELLTMLAKGELPDNWQEELSNG